MTFQNIALSSVVNYLIEKSIYYFNIAASTALHRSLVTGPQIICYMVAPTLLRELTVSHDVNIPVS